MSDYTIFGRRLRSDISFPELPPATPGAPSWLLRTSAGSPSVDAPRCIGTDQVDGDVHVRLYQGVHGFVLHFDDTGRFEVPREGAEIRWYPAPGANIEAARLDVMGRVLALALHVSGTFCLHGSAVAVDGRGIAFLAPKFCGKSTLALALARGGARLVTDDTVAVEPGPPAQLLPGVPRVRLWADSATNVAGGPAVEGVETGTKQTVDNLPIERLHLTAAPLDAVYLLAPVAASAAAAVRRRLLPPTPSTLALVRHAKLGPLLGVPESVVLFDLAVAIARMVPVYELAVMSEFHRLPEVVAQLLSWHSTPSPAPAAPL